LNDAIVLFVPIKKTTQGIYVPALTLPDDWSSQMFMVVGGFFPPENFRVMVGGMAINAIHK